ncbi:hypothetical protein SShM2_080 [Synechococcus phage S-ShM2]|uniref:Uncharacterized protein n=1 Tax=Synechococcus phage S-ShM2 TaxID=445683 RepID=E3SJY1_9CAUD|nr:hypothetical protein SShM2_080 [Synechococcus phage S-ShM2]ADO97691.1 hypothetical protein SShM2_080 [Synechococcus phage S-ShM2]
MLHMDIITRSCSSLSVLPIDCQPSKYHESKYQDPL